MNVTSGDDYMMFNLITYNLSYLARWTDDLKEGRW